MHRGVVLVSGVGGFIGNCLKQRLVNDSVWQLEGLSRQSFSAAGMYEFSERSLQELGRKSPYDAVINLAAHIADAGAESLSKNIEGNVETTKLLIEFAKRNNAKQFIHISSFSIFDGLRGMAIDEETLPAPISHYSQTKLASEYLVLAEKENFERGVVILRPAFTYGAGMRQTRMIPFFIQKLSREGALEVYDPHLMLQLSLVDDVVDAIVKVLKFNHSATVNVVNQQLSKIEMVRYLHEIMSSPAAVRVEDVGKAVPMVNELNTSRFKTLLGRSPVQFSQYIEEMDGLRSILR